MVSICQVIGILWQIIEMVLFLIPYHSFQVLYMDIILIIVMDLVTNLALDLKIAVVVIMAMIDLLLLVILIY